MNWIKEQFSLMGRFLGGGFRRTLVMCAVGLALAAVAGFGIGVMLPQRAAQVLGDFMAQIQESGVISEEGALSVAGMLMNNWRAMLVSAAYGFVPFLFLPVISLVMNGLLLGLLAGLFQAEGTSLLVYAAGILPHGIFELPALLFSVACGVTLCVNMCRIVTGNPEKRPLLEMLEDLLRVMVLAVAPLTVAAAFVECYITPVIMGAVM
jgi:stage II sporulation protein M